MSITSLVVISDLHCGDRLGLLPPEPITIDGGTVTSQNATQAAIWSAWREFWDEWVPLVTRGERFAVCVNGDALEGRHHGSTHQLTQNAADQQRIAEACLRPIRDRATHLIMIRGTEAHTGPSAENEEMLARALGADPDGDLYSRFEAFVEVGRCLVHASHHIGTTGSMAYETSAVTKEMNEFLADSARFGERPPDVIVRSHRHRQSRVYLDGHRGAIVGVVTGAWQGKTPYAYRVPGGRIMRPHIGGAVIRQGDEEHYVRTFLRTIPRPAAISLEG